MSVPQAKTQSMRLVMTLLITCLVSGAVLAAVYGWMNPMIEARKLERVKSVGLQGIFPDVDTFKEVEMAELPAGVEAPVYEVFDAAGKKLGIWFTGNSNGYGGAIRMAIGVNPDNAAVIGVRVLEQSETPGLGDKITEQSFLDQLTDKALSDAFAIGSDVQGITAATVSSRAVFNGVANMARGVLDVMGVEVKVEAAPAAAPADDPPVAAAAGEPEFADKIRSLMDDDEVAFESADLWEVRSGDALVGVAMVASKQGYAAPIKVLAIVDPATQTLVGAEVLEVNDTPGLGTQVQNPSFLDQFKGKSTADAFQIGGDLDGLTMATISAQATADAVKQAAETVVQLYSGN